MNLRLTRHHFQQNGIFGELVTEEGEFVADTLEHAYEAYGPAGGWVPKVRIGTYNCARHAPNRLSYETFLLEDVPPFMDKPVSGILIHRGNTEADTEGCILLGRSVWGVDRVPRLIANSRETFNRFMALQDGLDRFLLLIV